MKRVSAWAGRLVLAALLIVSAAPASARDRSREFGYQGWGPRVGLSINPDQVVVGAHMDLGDIIAYRLRFQPSAEVGIGDDATVIQFDANFQYHFDRDWDVWRPYAGGSIGLVSVSRDKGEDSSDLGLSASAGIEKNIGNNGFFIEGKIGIEDTPDWKFFVGWIF